MKKKKNPKNWGKSERRFIVLLLVPEVSLVWCWFSLVAHGSAET